jgi:hypothetical protein
MGIDGSVTGLHLGTGTPETRGFLKSYIDVVKLLIPLG